MNQLDANSFENNYLSQINVEGQADVTPLVQKMRDLGPDHPYNKDYEYPAKSDQSEEASEKRAEYRKAAASVGVKTNDKPVGGVKLM